jgi:tellurite resistance protein TehA-like permease
MLAALLPFVQGFTVLYWATGTWWLPMLVVLTLWRYAVRRDPLRPEGLDWSAVFPLGMYSAASTQLAHAVGLDFLHPLATLFFWIGVLAWSATAVARTSRLLPFDKPVLR